MARPSLAVVRRVEQPVHGVLERLRRVVGEERIDLRWLRKEPGQVERGAPEEHGLARFGRRSDPLLFELREDEGVDGRQRRPASRRRAHRGTASRATRAAPLLGRAPGATGQRTRRGRDRAARREVGCTPRQSGVEAAEPQKTQLMRAVLPLADLWRSSPRVFLRTAPLLPRTLPRSGPAGARDAAHDSWCGTLEPESRLRGRGGGVGADRAGRTPKPRLANVGPLEAPHDDVDRQARPAKPWSAGGIRDRCRLDISAFQSFQPSRGASFMLSLKRLLLAVAILSVPSVSNVFADVLDFEDLIGQAQLPSNYGGLTWDNNWTYYDWSQPPFDASSGNVRIYTHNFGGYVDFGSDVTFLGSWVASADVGQEMYWEGYNDGVKVRVDASRATRRSSTSTGTWTTSTSSRRASTTSSSMTSATTASAAAAAATRTRRSRSPRPSASSGSARSASPAGGFAGRRRSRSAANAFP